MKVVNRKIEIDYEPQVMGIHKDEVRFEAVKQAGQSSIYRLQVKKSHLNRPIQVKWKHEAIGVKGSWSSNNILDKRYRTDWEAPLVQSSISISSPLISLFGNHDQNILLIACSDPINNVHIEASLREEDNHFHCIISFFLEHSADEDYEAFILIDKEPKNFGQAIQEATEWIINAGNIVPIKVPKAAKLPLYSTWYSFHQSLDEQALLVECRLSKSLGYEVIIIDDGWQTKDDMRGYDYTGDWRQERFADVRSFVDQVHEIGMKIMFWFSVPFCGKKSDAYQKFQGKFLTENHYWAPVFDPRFPEVRSYLSTIYKKAILEWNIDGLKLDFIDDFKVYPETELKELNGRDTLSVAQGTQKLIDEISDNLIGLKPELLIEFRQQYVGPALLQLGNMFRAFDCPNDPLMNRVRTTDVKLICGPAAVHSDMVTWNQNEPVEIAALQMTNLLFSVPQLYVRLADRSEEEIKMIKHFTQYWLDNRDLLLGGKFTPHKPLANYPMLQAESDNQLIVAVYDDMVLPIELDFEHIHIINGKLSQDVIIKILADSGGEWDMRMVNHLGEETQQKQISLLGPIHHFSCPSNGIIFLNKKI